MAFLLRDYVVLLDVLRSSGYSFGPVRSYYQGYSPPRVFLRHDVDRMPDRAVAMARAEHDAGASATYYVRCSPQGVFPTVAIGGIHALGHEIGFHYETMSRCRGDAQRAAERFERELEQLRKLVPVSTVAAHGAPLSSFSNVGFGKKVDLKRLDLLGEASLDFDFSSILYVTDTGGIFGSKANMRDRVRGKKLDATVPPSGLGRLLRPQGDPLVLLNCHPERWPDTARGLIQAHVTDGAANLAKRLVGIANRLRDALHPKARQEQAW